MNPKPTVELFIPCFIDQVYPETGFNMVKVLEKVGCKVIYNPNQTCCGQPAYNAGFFAEGKEVAEKFLDDFKGQAQYIVAPSASCVGMVRNAYETFFGIGERREDYLKIKNRIFEFTEFLVDVLHIEKIEGASLRGVATYHDSCSALRECDVKEAPRKLLSNVKGLQLKEMINTEDCCGFGGTFAVKFEAISSGMAAQKLENANETKADFLITTDSSCILHLEAYSKKQSMKIKPMHIADVLASGW